MNKFIETTNDVRTVRACDNFLHSVHQILWLKYASGRLTYKKMVSLRFALYFLCGSGEDFSNKKHKHYNYSGGSL